MPNKVLVHGLERKFARLMGEFETAEQEIEGAYGLAEITAATVRIDERKREITEALSHLTAVIRLFVEGWDPATVKAIYPKRRPAKTGGYSREAMRVLRISKVPLRTREIAHRIAERRGESRDARNIARISVAVLNALKPRQGKLVHLHTVSPQTWALHPPEGETLAARDRAANIPPTTSKGGPWTRPGGPKRTARRY